MHLSHHASISYALHTLCGHASILRASIFCAHFCPFSANTSTASSGEHWRVLVRTHMLAACAQCLLHARYMLAASFLQALASILSRAYFYKGSFDSAIVHRPLLLYSLAKHHVHARFCIVNSAPAQSVRVYNDLMGQRTITAKLN